MEMKRVYEVLEKVENGADLIAAIKGEINTLNNAAKVSVKSVMYEKNQDRIVICTQFSGHRLPKKSF